MLKTATTKTPIGLDSISEYSVCVRVFVREGSRRAIVLILKNLVKRYMTAQRPLVTDQRLITLRRTTISSD